MIINPYRFSSGPPPQTWNPSDKGANIILSNSDLTAGNTAGAWATVRTVFSANSGKLYDEATLTYQPTDLSCMFGVCTASHTLTNYCGSAAGGWSIQGKGSTGVIRTFLAGVATNRTGTIAIGGRAKIAIDIDAGQGWMAGVGLAWIGGGDPAAGTSPTFTFTAGTTLYFAGSAFSSNIGTVTRVGGSYTDTVPTGFTGIG